MSTKEQAHTAAIQSEIERFEDQYIPEPNSGCWIWIGSLFSSKVAKYARGKVRIAGKEQVASRFSFQLFKGEIPTGLFVCHRCDTPLCVNPDHLWLGTHADNMADMVAKNRYRPRGKAKSAYNRGRLNPRAKLTEEAVREIRISKKGTNALAARYGVSQWTIHNVLERRVWRHVK